MHFVFEGIDLFYHKSCDDTETSYGALSDNTFVLSMIDESINLCLGINIHVSASTQTVYVMGVNGHVIHAIDGMGIDSITAEMLSADFDARTQGRMWGILCTLMDGFGMFRYMVGFKYAGYNVVFFETESDALDVVANFISPLLPVVEERVEAAVPNMISDIKEKICFDLIMLEAQDALREATTTKDNEWLAQCVMTMFEMLAC